MLNRIWNSIRTVMLDSSSGLSDRAADVDPRTREVSRDPQPAPIHPEDVLDDVRKKR